MQIQSHRGIEVNAPAGWLAAVATAPQENVLNFHESWTIVVKYACLSREHADTVFTLPTRAIEEFESREFGDYTGDSFWPLADAAYRAGIL